MNHMYPHSSSQVSAVRRARRLRIRREMEMETMSRRPFARHTVHFDKKESDSGSSTEKLAVTTALTPAAVEPLHADETVSVHGVVVSLPNVDDSGKLAIGCVLVKTAN